MQRLLAAVDAAGVRVVRDAKARRLVTDGGAVVGVEADVDSAMRTFAAGRGVVLTAGGFMQNREMVARHCPAALRCKVPLGTEHDDGSGIAMATEVGAATVGMDRIEVGIPFTPPRSIVRGILVNGAGRRFINEDTYAGRLGQEFLLRQHGRVFFVHSDDTFAVNIVGMTPTWVAETAAELESEIGLPAGSLQTTLDRYNASAADGEDPEFHKASEWVVPLEPPYGVVDWSVDAAIYAPFTLGGLATDVDGAVLDDDGAPIPGLYAAGRTTAGIAAGGYVSGISLGDGTFFGRRAGRAAAS